MNVADELKTYLQVLWHFKWIIAACAVIAAIVALGISFILTPVYKATTTVRIASSPGGYSDYTYTASFTRLSNTYVEIATSDISLDEVVERIGLEEQPEVEVEVVPETELILISASDPDPARARDIANTLAGLLVEQSLQLYGGDAPTAREILEEQLQQAKADLDAAVVEYDLSVRAALVTTTPPVSDSPIPDLNLLERIVNIRQQLYNNLLQEYQLAKNTEQIELLEEQVKQAKIDLDSSIAEYNDAIRAYRPTETPPASGNLPISPDVEALARLVSVRQLIYSDLLQKYESARTSEQLRINAITIVEPAVLPIKPSSPKKTLNAALGLIAGLLLGVILAFLFESLDDTVRNSDDVQAMANLPILGRVPVLKKPLSLKSSLGFSGSNHLSPAPAFDQLRSYLMLYDCQPKSTAYLITSAEPGDGKSTIVANLAVSLSQAGNRVVLVDMDFRRPRLHSFFRLPNVIGLSDCILGGIRLEDALQKTTNPNLDVITAGSVSQGVLDQFNPDYIRDLFEILGGMGDYVLIDAPAILSVADPIMLASQAGAVILVVTRRKTERRNVRLSLRQLIDLKIKVVGIVMNKEPDSPNYRYYTQVNNGSGRLSDQAWPDRVQPTRNK